MKGLWVGIPILAVIAVMGIVDPGLWKRRLSTGVEPRENRFEFGPPWRMRGFGKPDREEDSPVPVRVQGQFVIGAGESTGGWKFVPELPTPNADVHVKDLGARGLYAWVRGGRLYRLSRETGEPIWITSGFGGVIGDPVTDRKRMGWIGVDFVASAGGYERRIWLVAGNGDTAEVGNWTALTGTRN